MSRTRLTVFCGPSLPPPDRVVEAGIEYRGPAARGDVERAAAESDAVLLIDGVFHHDLAPAPKECYRASQMTALFGASSMGALRVAECAPYGAIPLGIIARWYASEVIDGDDEVAVAVDPRSQRALSVPLVNVRYAAWLAARRGLLSQADAATLVGDAREVFYADRTWDDVFDLVPERARERFAEIALRDGDLKCHDARFALRSVLRRYPVAKTTA